MRPSVVENEFSLICMTDKQFFFIYLTEGHMPGIWSWLGKEREREKEGRREEERGGGKADRENEWECGH